MSRNASVLGEKDALEKKRELFACELNAAVLPQADNNSPSQPHTGSTNLTSHNISEKVSTDGRLDCIFISGWYIGETWANSTFFIAAVNSIGLSIAMMELPDVLWKMYILVPRATRFICAVTSSSGRRNKFEFFHWLMKNECAPRNNILHYYARTLLPDRKLAGKRFLRKIMATGNR